VDLIPDMPSDNKVQLFADYIMSTSGSFWAGTSDFYVCRWLNLCKSV
jgi:hypothetical protein